MENKVLVFTTTFDHMAHLIKGALEAQGIEVLVLNQKDSSYKTFGEIELYVMPDDVSRAREIIAEGNHE